MPNYVKYPLTTDQGALVQQWVDELRIYFPNYVPADGQLAYRGATVLIGMIAEGLDVASLIPDEIFKTLGAKLHNLPPIEATNATADTTWVMRDDAGYPEIPVGTLVSIDGVFFETTDAFNVPSGQTTAGPIGIQAVDEGAAASGLGAPGAIVDLEEGYEFVATITLNAATANGQDAEDVDVYLTRLRDLFTLMSPRAIGASQLATLARTVVGVDAALALKGYNPATGTFDNEGYAAVAVRDALGLAVPVPTKDAVAALLQGPSDRLANTNISIIDPTWTTVDVTWEGICLPTADPVATRDAGNAAVALVLDPSQFGLPPSGEDKTWTLKSKIWHYDIAAALKNVEGLLEVVSVTIGLAGGAQVEADVDLPGVAPLPLAGAIVGTVNLP
jgi:hypothetical protein